MAIGRISDAWRGRDGLECTVTSRRHVVLYISVYVYASRIHSDSSRVISCSRVSSGLPAARRTVKSDVTNASPMAKLRRLNNLRAWEPHNVSYDILITSTERDTAAVSSAASKL